MRLIYIAGPYTGRTYSAIEDNIRKAENAAIALWARGWAVITPHLNTAHFERYETATGITYHTWLNGTLEMLKRSDAIFMLNSWEQSKGARLEHKHARENKMKVYYEFRGYPQAADHE